MNLKIRSLKVITKNNNIHVTIGLFPFEKKVKRLETDLASNKEKNIFVEKVELDAAPFILYAGGGRIMNGAGGTAYGRGDFTDGYANAYGLFRASVVYKDPVTEEVLGLEAKEIGLANVISNEKDIVKLELVKTSQQVVEGDRLLTTENRQVIARFQPKAPDDYVDGFIISVPGGVTQIGQYSMIVINKGTRDGVTEGAVLDIMTVSYTHLTLPTNREV